MNIITQENRITPSPSIFTRGATQAYLLGKSIAHTLHQFKDACVEKIITVAARIFHPFATNALLASSSRKFKSKIDPHRVEASRTTLKEIGGQELSLQTAQGHTISAFYFDAKTCLEKLKEKGAVLDIISNSEGKTEKVLWLSPEAKALISEMKLPIENQLGKEYISLGIPENQTSTAQLSKGAAIYATGSGHLFEFRRKTIGTFVFNYGMNLIVFNYSGSGRSKGNASEQATYADIDAAYNYLQQQGFKEERILSYGHCSGAGPALKLAEKHPRMHLLADRTFTTTGELAYLRVKKKLGRLSFLAPLMSWIAPVMLRCYQFDNQQRMQKLRGHVCILNAIHDHLIPRLFLEKLFDNARAATTRILIDIDSNHDVDLAPTEKSRQQIGEFLHRANLLGY